ncbi:MAG: 2Fe-2S iron-sulfur cluster binding domain-containing protein, partial [Clostridiales bacterium]|nr:2Fe-2S iron-sulfur cluster binding domain-containing protein [Clostridiales bacterium]
MLLYHTVTVRWEGDAARKTVVLKAERGENLLRLLQRSDIGILAPCGGGGRCGKCLVYLGAAEGAAPPPLPDPIPALLSQEAIAEGRRLACGVAVDRDLVVTILGEGGAAKIATAGISRKVRFAPYVQKRALTLPKPSLLDQRPDAERVADAVRIAAKAAGAAASAAELASNASESASKAANSAAAFEFNAPLLRRLPGL